MEKIVLEKIQINKNKLTYFYSVTDKISKYFMPTREYSIKYEMNIEGVPKNILAIPFVCNVLPISWLFDAEIVVEELDADFLNSVNPIKSSYQNMYPNLKFMGELKCEKIIQNNYTFRIIIPKHSLIIYRKYYIMQKTYTIIISNTEKSGINI